MSSLADVRQPIRWVTLTSPGSGAASLTYGLGQGTDSTWSFLPPCCADQSQRIFFTYASGTRWMLTKGILTVSGRWGLCLKRWLPITLMVAGRWPPATAREAWTGLGMTPIVPATVMDFALGSREALLHYLDDERSMGNPLGAPCVPSFPMVTAISLPTPMPAENVRRQSTRLSRLPD